MQKIIERYIDKIINGPIDKPLWKKNIINDDFNNSWGYSDGLMMMAFINLYKIDKDKKYLNFVIKYVDQFISDNGTIKCQDDLEYSVFNFSLCRILIDLVEENNKMKYIRAIYNTYNLIQSQKRTIEGNFCTDHSRPNQIFIEDMFLTEPFYLRFETEYDADFNSADVINHFFNIRKLMFNEQDKLYYHGYDSSKRSYWADDKTGLSKSYWLYSIGFYLVAYVDVIASLNCALKRQIISMVKYFKEALEGVLKYQDDNSKMFYQIVNRGDDSSNYLETTGSAMICYALLKGVSICVLDKSYRSTAIEIFNGICERCLTEDDGEFTLKGSTNKVSLGPEYNSLKDGSYKHYIDSPCIDNDCVGIAALLLSYSQIKKMK